MMCASVIQLNFADAHFLVKIPLKTRINTSNFNVDGKNDKSYA